MQAAKARGVKLGGTNAQSIANRNEANKRAKELRPILTELASLSANKAAAELNRRGVATPQGGQWHAAATAACRTVRGAFIHAKAAEFTALHDDWLFKIAARAENLRSLSHGRARTVCRAGLSKAVCAGRFPS